MASSRYLPILPQMWVLDMTYCMHRENMDAPPLIVRPGQEPGVLDDVALNLHALPFGRITIAATQHEARGPKVMRCSKPKRIPLKEAQVCYARCPPPPHSHYSG